MHTARARLSVLTSCPPGRLIVTLQLKPNGFFSFNRPGLGSRDPGYPPDNARSAPVTRRIRDRMPEFDTSVFIFPLRDKFLVHDQLDLAGMSDSDWAVRHSTTGFVFQYAQAAISWGSKKQASVALSSCEAEIMALSEASK